MKIWIDADACPGPIREIIVRAAIRLGIHAVFVANKALLLPTSPLLSSVQVSLGPDIVDHYLVEQAQPFDLVITQDIPLAARLVAQTVSVITPRGQLYDQNNINEALANRDLLTELRDTGSIQGGPRPFDEKAKRRFANNFDAELSRLLRKR